MFCSILDLTCVIIHLLKSVTGGKKKLKRKFSMDWELLLKWWYCCYGIVEDHQKFSEQQVPWVPDNFYLVSFGGVLVKFLVEK